MKSAPNDKLKREKVKEEDKVKVFVNDRVKRDSFGKVIKTTVKTPLSPSRRNNTNNNTLQIQTHKLPKYKVNPSNSIEKPSVKINRKPGGQTYAVNYCMCGSRKGNKNIFNDEQIMDTYIKSSNDFMQEANLPCIRRSKPILLPSPESVQHNNNKTKNKPRCGSNCVCLNKVPSSKSIDKLLETLMKWKCDLNASNNVCPDINCPYGSEWVMNAKNSNINELVQELVNSISNAIESRSMTRVESHVTQKSYTGKNNIPSTPMKLVSSNVIQRMEGQNRSLPMHPLVLTNTQSEYMGAINLEKSNENNCKCNFRADKTTVDMDVNTEVCSIQPYESRRQKCSQEVNSVLSTIRKEDSEIKRNTYLNASRRSSSYERRLLKKPDDRPTEGKVPSNIPSQLHNRASQVDGSVRLFLDSLKEIVEDKSNMVEDKSKILENISNIEKDKPKMVEDQPKDRHRDQTLEMDQIVKPSVGSCDCDYEIKFMGVTLRDTNENKDINENKRINNEQKQNPYADKIGDGLRKKEANKYPTQENIDFGQYFSNVTSKLSLGKLIDNKPSCLCNINISDFKELIANLNKHISNQDKGLDTKSLAGTEMSKQSACVCCFKDKDETQNLEVNTFYLLKEHLKQKLSEFKEHCQSSCIPPEEENKAFTLILEKIKQTISEAADRAICKCAEGEPIDGTWKRAYCLLQEYLKTKISRVHCKCPYPMEYNESLVPDVSAKVCILIEKDFQRLKGLCKCLNTSINDKDGLGKTFQFQLPEKDISNGGKVSKQVSNTSIIITQTASAQVQPNLIMETKSCEVVQETIEEQSGVGIIRLSSGPKPYSSDTTEFIVSQCQTTIADKHSSHDSKTIGPIPSVNINRMDITNDEDTQNKGNQLALPLIGYTVDCTCNSYLGSCVCSKATVQKNNKKIEEIWYDVLSKSNKKVNDKNISYIMDNVKSTTNKSVDKMCLHEIPRDVCIRHLINIDNVQQVNRDVMDNKTSVENMYEDLKIKVSGHKPMYSTHYANTDAEIVSNLDSDNYADGSFSALYGYMPQTNPDTSKSTPVSVPARPCVQRTKSEIHDANFSKSYLQSCDCSTVPICHVKMLVKSIERKLIQSDCTCDSMNSKVCPIHSRKNL